jgi:hypothetical protein
MKQNHTKTSTTGPAGTTASVNEGLWVRRRVYLNDEVHRRNVQPAGSDVCGEKDGRGVSVNETVEVLLTHVRRVFSVERY